MTQHIDPYAALVERDRSLPGLRIVFEPERLARVLEAHSGVSLSSIERVYVRYKRRTNCLVGYSVNGPMGRSYVYAKALRPTADDKLEKPLLRDAAATWLGPGPLVLREAAVTVWAHPNDDKLRTLRFLAGDEGRSILLRRGPIDAKDAASTVFRTLSYKPERRFVAELETRVPPPRRAVLRMYTRSGYEKALARSALAMSRDVLQVPARLAQDTRRHLLFFDWVEGRLAADLVSATEPLLGRMTLVGEALAQLHAQPVNVSLPPPACDLDSATNAISDVEFLFPRLAVPLARLRACLSDVSAELRQPTTLVHGDFHLRQVLLSPSSVAFVDFDRAGAGCAISDIAYCRAHLERDVLAGVLTRDRADAVMEELLAGYQRVRSRPFSAVIDIHTAAALALLLPEPFRLFRPDAFDLTVRMVDRALALVAHAESRTVAS